MPRTIPYTCTTSRWISCPSEADAIVMATAVPAGRVRAPGRHIWSVSASITPRATTVNGARLDIRMFPGGRLIGIAHLSVNVSTHVLFEIDPD